MILAEGMIDPHEVNPGILERFRGSEVAVSSVARAGLVG
jgi:hypothetical protein